ncbi:MAG: hypothetical protein ABIQ89_03505 [Candidatus Saccharimonadales bacterium]
MRIIGEEVALNQLEACALLLPDWQAAPKLIEPEGLYGLEHLEWLNSQENESPVRIPLKQINFVIMMARDMRQGYETVIGDVRDDPSADAATKGDATEMGIHNNSLMNVITYLSNGVNDSSPR